MDSSFGQTTSQVPIITQDKVNTPLIRSEENSKTPDYFRFQNIETLLESGRRLSASGDYAMAEQAFSQAKQTIRANLGLHSREQFVAIDLLLEVLIAQQQWDKLDRHIAYSEWLAEKIFAEQPIDYAQQLLRTSDQLMSAALTINENNQNYYLTKSRRLNWLGVTAIQENFGKNDPRQVPQLYKIALSHYFQRALGKTAGAANLAYDSYRREIVDGWGLPKNEAVSYSYNVGRQVLKRIGTIFQKTRNQPETSALTNIYLSDWDYLFGKHSLAQEGYQVARTQLQDIAIDPDEIDQLFYNDVPIPLGNPASSWQDFISLTKQNDWMEQLGVSSIHFENHSTHLSLLTRLLP